MVKYVDTTIGFSEFPHEIALLINISGCPNHCPGCHSAYLAEDIGTELTLLELNTLMENNKGITCIGFLGGDQDPAYINTLAEEVKNTYPEIKIGWYSGKPKISEEIDIKNFDYIKIGPYDKEKGPLNSPSTNQIFYAKGEHLHKMSAYSGQLYDVTSWFWDGTR